MCTCVVSRKMSGFMGGAYRTGFHVGQAHAADGAPCEPMPARTIKQMIRALCPCDTVRVAARHIARAWRSGYEIGHAGLYAVELAERERGASNVAHIDEAVARRAERARERVG